MSANIETHRVQQFANTVQLLLQRRGGVLTDKVMRGSHIGKQASPVDQWGAVSAQRVTGRFQPIGRVDATNDRRWVFPVDYDLNQIIDTFDLLRLLNDPKSSYVTNAVQAMGRAMDDEIIAAFFGDAKTGESAGTTTAFPTANQIAVNFKGGGNNTGLTVAKLREARRLLMKYHNDPNDSITCAITSKQHDDLLGEYQIASRDFSDRPHLVDGKVTRFLGIDFVHCEGLATDGSSYRRIPVFIKSGMYLGEWESVKTDITQRKDMKGLPWQAYLYGTFGATRLEENKVVEIKASEA